MENLEKLVATLASLKKASISLIQQMIPIMEEIATDGNDIIDEIVERTGMDQSAVEDYIHQLTLDIVKDAESVKKEIDAFAKATENATVEKNISQYPFLAEVWLGDAYDNTEGLPALEKLLKDILGETKKADDDWIIEHCVKKLSK